MDRLLIVLAPIAAVGLWLGLRWATRRPLGRLGLNVVFSLLLLVYLLSTAALGLFWVANQELPVFDWHYLFGYATLFLLTVHLWFNFPVVVAYVSRSPAAVRGPGSGRAGRVLAAMGLALYGGACYFLGLRHGSDVIEVQWAAPVPAQSPAVIARPHSAAPAPSPTVIGRPSPRAPPARPTVRPSATTPRSPVARPWRGSPAKPGLDPPGLGPVSVVTTYHIHGSHSRRRLLLRAAGAAWGIPDPYKEISGGHPHRLPRPSTPGRLQVSRALLARGVPSRITTAPLGLEELGEILLHTSGITQHRGGRAFRAAASSGALFPVEVHVLARRVEGLAPGLYHYGPREHALGAMAGEEAVEALAAAVDVPVAVREAPATVLLGLVFARTGQKYLDRAYRYALLDLGHSLANLVAAVTDLGRPAQVVGRFDDARVEALLGIDGLEQAVLVLVPLSEVEGPPRMGPGAWTFRPPPARFPRRAGVTAMVHRATSLVLAPAGGAAPARLHPDPGPLARVLGKRRAPPPAHTWRDLPRPGPGTGRVGETIRRRRSRRAYLPGGMSLADLSSLLHHALSTTSLAPGPPPPATRLERSRGVCVRVIAVEVGDLEPGVYEYDRSGHRLRLLRAGDFSDEASGATVQQKAIGNAPVVIVFVADLARALAVDGVRGYRYALMDTGVLGGNLYLEAGARGMGTCSVGAFYDDEALLLVAGDPAREVVLMFSGIGRVHW